MKARAKVFEDVKGNQMLFPGYIYTADDLEPLETEFWRISNEVRLATALVMQPGWLEIDTSNFRYFVSTITSNGFARGQEEVYVFAGPVFERCVEAMLKDTQD